MLRGYQEKAIDCLRSGIRAGHRRLLLVSPTGSGKTQIAAEMIRGAVSKGHRVLVVAHRRELIYQVQDRLKRDHALESGTIMAGHKPKADLPIQVASIQTLVRRQFPDVEMVVIDEAHHAKASTYEKVLSNYPDAWAVGLTATPWRLDGKGLGDLFTHLVVASTPKELQSLGFLCPGSGKAYLAPDFSKVKMVGADYDPAGLSLAYEQSSVLGDIVQRWKEHANGLRTIVFAASISNSLTLVENFRAAGIKAEHLDHLTKRQEREEIIARMRSGETTVISNVGILGEGVDVPELECCVLARPTKSLAFFLQMVGRVLRPAGGKAKAIIHDHGQLCLTHGFWDDDRDYSLLATKPKKPGAAPTKSCPECFCICPASATECPECGYVFERKEKEHSEEHVELTLEELRERMKPVYQRDELFLSLMRVAKLTGRRPGWVIYKIKEKIPSCPFPSSLWSMYVGGVKGAWHWL